MLAVIYIEFALSCFSSLKLYTFYFNVYLVTEQLDLSPVQIPTVLVFQF